MKFVRLIAVPGLLLFSLGSLAGVHTAGAAPGGAGHQTVQKINAHGMTSFGDAVIGADLGMQDIAVQPNAPETNLKNNNVPDSNIGTRDGHSLSIPNPAASPVAPNNPGFTGFNGINHRDQRLADGGNQFSLEPPDQGLCVGNGFAIDAVNDALDVYNTSTHALVAGPAALDPFFGHISEFHRPGGPFGPFISDPKCYFDASTNRWFITALTLGVNPANGHFNGTGDVEIAVSASGNPTGAYRIFTFDTTDNTGTPDHANCPCFGDQPLIGADANGFYVTTNEFPIFANGFNGAQVYAIPKATMIAAVSSPTLLTSIIHFSGIGLAEGQAYSIQPATSPTGAFYGHNRITNFDPARGGSEYFMSALQFDDSVSVFDNRIAAWALTNTSSLNSASPSLTLTSVVLPSETYGDILFSARQKDGTAAQRPLGTSLGEPLERVTGNDDRMNQVVYAAGRMYGALNTMIAPIAGTTRNRIAIAYFVIDKGPSTGAFSPTMTTQGYIAAPGSGPSDASHPGPFGNDVMFPSIGVNISGQGAMAFSIVGPNYNPSMAYVPFNGGGTGPIHIGGAGAGPEDGFTGYHAFGGNGITRWGDYSAAVADSNGSIWMAAEYIPGGARTSLANWGTFVGQLTP